MGTFKNREDYLKGLCIAHPLVLHEQPRGDGTNRNSFFRYNSEEELSTASFENIDYPCVGHFLLEGNLRDESNAYYSIKHQFKNGWIFLHKADVMVEGAAGVTDEVQNAYDIAFGVMEDFIKTMKDDFEANGSCGAFDDLPINSMNYVSTGPWLQNLYGWILYFDTEIKATRIN